MKQKKINNSDQLSKSLCGGFRGHYIAPAIELIELDNEISLALESTPPIGPDEGFNMFQNTNFANPYKSDQA